MLVQQNTKFFIIVIVLSVTLTLFQIQLTKLQEKLDKLGAYSHQDLDNPTNFILIEEFHESKPSSRSILRRLSDNTVVVYNRVPKTGSTSFVGIAYDLCKRGQYHVLHVNVTGNNHILSLNNQLQFIQNVTEWTEIKPALYHGHFAFVDFAKFGAPKPLYINLIRKPLDRFVSYYYFLRYGDNFRPHLIRKKAGNTMSFDECVEKQLSECDPSAMWLQVPFFCGHAANCWKPANKWALTEAKKNLVNNYFLVGVTEELDDFIGVLEQSLPRLFKGASDYFLNSNKSHLRRTVQKETPNSVTINKFKQNPVWQMENEFYEFALDNFHFIKRHTLRNKHQSFFYEKIRPRQS
ncbi:hypothetical protein ABEB36_011721 [Hypothenemus hampei]|uniref:Heparin sulfate O-sulfotransferase n=1 Tax=Hypothenemus hampei TaxID=57062 RepID=A0ABD1E918_HYPHA